MKLGCDWKPQHDTMYGHLFACSITACLSEFTAHTNRPVKICHIALTFDSTLNAGTANQHDSKYICLRIDPTPQIGLVGLCYNKHRRGSAPCTAAASTGGSGRGGFNDAVTVAQLHSVTDSLHGLIASKPGLLDKLLLKHSVLSDVVLDLYSNTNRMLRRVSTAKGSLVVVCFYWACCCWAVEGTTCLVVDKRAYT